MATATEEPIVLSDEEAADLYRFMLHLYISYTEYPALRRLLNRVDVRVAESRCR